MTDGIDPKMLRRIRRAIRKLPRDQRAVFCAIRFDDLTYAEIGERFGLSVSEVEHLFADALVTFMRQLDEKTPRWWHLW